MRKVLIIALGLASFTTISGAYAFSDPDCVPHITLGVTICRGSFQNPFHPCTAADVNSLYATCVAAKAAKAAQARQKASNAALVAAARNSVRPQDGPAHSTPDQGGGAAPKYPAQGALTTMKSFTPAKPASGLHFNTP